MTINILPALRNCYFFSDGLTKVPNTQSESTEDPKKLYTWGKSSQPGEVHDYMDDEKSHKPGENHNFTRSFSFKINAS
jgi:hypothetical protein